MLTIRCAKCKTKLFKYKKIGLGQVLRCYKDRMENLDLVLEDNLLSCVCGNNIGTDMGTHYKMKTQQFIYTGKKEKG